MAWMRFGFSSGKPKEVRFFSIPDCPSPKLCFSHRSIPTLRSTWCSRQPSGTFSRDPWWLSPRCSFSSLPLQDMKTAPQTFSTKVSLFNLLLNENVLSGPRCPAVSLSYMPMIEETMARRWLTTHKRLKSSSLLLSIWLPMGSLLVHSYKYVLGPKCVIALAKRPPLS